MVDGHDHVISPIPQITTYLYDYNIIDYIGLLLLVIRSSYVKA